MGDWVQHNQAVELLKLLRAGLIFTAFLLFLFTISCRNESPQTGHEQKKAGTAKRDIRKKPPSSFQDSMFIKSRAAVFFEPDSLQMEKIKGVYEKMIFESLTHECYYKMNYARKVLDMNWKGLPVKLASKFRWLIFRKSTGKDSIIDLNNINYICGVYLFDPQKNPILTDMTSIDTQLDFYFRKK
jgi:hypothetical protein